MLMVHSASTQTWEKTFAGDEGYKNIFLRRGFSVHIADAPRVGRGGKYGRRIRLAGVGPKWCHSQNLKN